MDHIQFFEEDTSFNHPNAENIKEWLNKVALNYEQAIEQLNYIYCSDNYLLEINQHYLNHDYYTDIITFDQRDSIDLPIEADIFISIERVRDNAELGQVAFIHELNRVHVHGLLHLLGFEDHTADQKEVMRKTEDACLSLLPNW